MNLKELTFPKNLNVAELQRRLQSRSVLAISLETTELTVALMRRETNDTRAVSSFVVPIGAEAVIADPERAGNALAEALDREKIRERRCVICLPRRWALTAVAEMPEVSGEDLKAFLELRAEREFGGAGELRLTHSAFSLGDGKRYATLAGIPARRVEAVQRMLETAGCRAVSIALGLDRPARLGREAASLQFIANCDYVDLVVAAGGGVTALRTLPAPAGPNFDAPAFVREVRITLGRLPEPVRKGIAGARFSGARDTVESLMSEAGEPLRKLGITQLEREPSGAGAHPAIDAAERFLRNEPVLFELVEHETKPWQAALAKLDGKKRRWIALGVAAFIVLPALTLMVRSHTESSLAEEWDAMKGEVAELDQLQQRMRQFRPWFEATPQALQCLESVASCFPERADAWAKSVQLSEAGKVTVVGFAKNHGAISELQQNLRKKPGVKDVQIQQVKTDKVMSFTIIFQWEGKNAS